MTENGPKWPVATSWSMTLGEVVCNKLLVRGDNSTVATINYTFADELYIRLT